MNVAIMISAGFVLGCAGFMLGMMVTRAIDAAIDRQYEATRKLNRRLWAIRRERQRLEWDRADRELQRFCSRHNFTLPSEWSEATI